MPEFKVILSDLHLGAGPAGAANPLEDFHRGSELAGLLASLVAESERDRADVELFFNGDTFEMLQVPHVDTFDPGHAYPASLYRSSVEADSARKMALIVAGHPGFFSALRSFLEAGPPRRAATFVRGNHDLDLHWPAVQSLIRQAVGANGDRSPLLAFEEWRVCRDGLYVEHGSQYAEVLSRVEDMEVPLNPDRPGELALPLGSWLVTDVFNAVERERYWVDGVKPVTALVWYALALDFGFATRALVALLRALPGVIRAGFLGLPADKADLLRQLEDPERVEEISARYREQEVFRAWFHSEVARVLDAQDGTAQTTTRARAARKADALEAGEREREAVRSALFEAAARRAEEVGAAVVTFGHTHDAGLEPLPNGGVYANSGTWTWRADLTGEGKATWRDLFEHPERFVEDHTLTYVRVDYGEEGPPLTRLLTWEEEDVVAPVRPAPWWRRAWEWVRKVWGTMTRGGRVEG